MKEVASFTLGRQVSALQTHAAVISSLCRQRRAGCRSGDRVETQPQVGG